jgi:IS605 OrfB family transposase
VLLRYSDAWFEAARRHHRGERAGFPRRKRFLVPIRCYHGTFLLAGDRRVRAQRRAEARHRRRVHQAHHQAAGQVIAFAMAHRVGTLVVGDPTGITDRDAGRVQNWRLGQWRRTHLLGALRDKAEQAGIRVSMVQERGTSSTCPACRQRVPKPRGRRFACPHCRFQGHRGLVGVTSIAAKLGGGHPSTAFPALVEHCRVGMVPRATPTRILAGRGCRSSDAPASPGSGEDQAASPSPGKRYLKGHWLSARLCVERRGS